MTTSLLLSEIFKTGRDFMQKRIFPGRYESLEEISRFVVQAAKEAGLDENAVYSVELAVDEACTNIVEHAYGGDGKGTIECRCTVLDEGLMVELIDHGRSFNPKKVPKPKIGGKLSQVKSRGAGLYLIMNLMDEVNFDFSKESGNRLVMVKKK